MSTVIQELMRLARREWFVGRLGHATRRVLDITQAELALKVGCATMSCLAKTPASYIGLIGSRRRWQTTRKLLIEDGMAESTLARLCLLIGLELNA